MDALIRPDRSDSGRHSGPVRLACRVLFVLAWGAIGFVLAPTVSDAGQSPPANAMKIPLADVPPVAAVNTALTAIDAWGMMELKQSAKDGLRLSLMLVNKGPAAVSLLDPAERSGPQLLTEAGWPVALPAQVSSWRINTGQRETPKVLTLPPGQEHRVAVSVMNILADQKHMNVPGRSQSTADAVAVMPLPPGSYRVKLQLVLALASGAPGESRPIRMLASDEIKVAVVP